MYQIDRKKLYLTDIINYSKKGQIKSWIEDQWIDEYINRWIERYFDWWIEDYWINEYINRWREINLIGGQVDI